MDKKRKRFSHGDEQKLYAVYSGSAVQLGRNHLPGDDGRVHLNVDGKIFGGIYDDRLLVKPVQAARACLKDAPEEVPYEGVKPMLLVENVDDRDALAELVRSMEEELPAPKPKKKK